MEGKRTQQNIENREPNIYFHIINIKQRTLACVDLDMFDISKYRTKIPFIRTIQLNSNYFFCFIFVNRKTFLGWKY